MSLDQDQQLHSGCHDKTTLGLDSSDSCELAKQPLQGLKLASHKVLETAQQTGRLKCSKCGGSRMFFCYTCCSLVGVSIQEIPIIKLPVKIDIIKHPNETDGKSTAIHAKILAPNDATIYTYPCIPEYEKDKVVLVFPGSEAISVKDILRCLGDRRTTKLHDHFDELRPKRLKIEEVEEGTQAAKNPEAEATDEESKVFPLQRVVFIDSTWNQTNKIITDERLQGLLQVELKTRKTCFWRRQKGKPDTYLSTIEAIYYFLLEFHQSFLAQEYNGEYDNLLFFYSYLHSVINKAKTSAAKCKEQL
ncbi:tRNA-uridine aminocarboxypropyltransferase 1 [Oryzias melastigma]|uniref:tRNA-uridine aminocarboxypropyltransferase 1 n=1 Tax=Oryzias melastigma TaxID=30732 RepID=A0A3B3BTS7_ORYME|nr:tRNA-uridine aminocarboxypropyltransferase 1 [Oryzias melastigma]XP_024150836.1 tRNA-uridine aminocarboxypropyltransferase 1 [Oryzias melastigma]